MEKVDTLVVDKTGTLTEGKPKVVAVVPAEGETIIFVVVESRLSDLFLPEINVVTNRKVLIAKPSIFSYLGMKSMALRNTYYVNYTKINDLELKKSLYLRSIEIAIAGSLDGVKIEGLRVKDAELLAKFVERVVSFLE